MRLSTIAMILFGAAAGTVIGVIIGCSRDEKPSKLAIVTGLLSGIAIGFLSYYLFSVIL